MGSDLFDRGFRRRAQIALALVALIVVRGDARLIAQERDEPPVETDREAELRQLVEAELPRLSAALRADRVSAEARLLEAGPALLDWLPPADAVDDAATREALRRIRAELEWRAALSSVQPGRVTLQGMMTLTEIVQDITAQTGNPVSIREADDSPGDTQVDVDYHNVPFWDALSDLSNRLELHADVQADRQAVVLAPADEESAVARTTAGAFRVAALSVLSRGGVVGVELAVTGEPRLRPLFLSWTDADFVARTSVEQTLRPLSPEARRELPTVDRGPCRFSIVFEVTEPESAAAIALAGKFVVTTAALTQQFRFRDLDGTRRESQRRGGVTVSQRGGEFSTTRSGVRRAEIELGIVYDTGGPAFESHRTWVYHNEVFLETADGTRLPVNDGFETLGEQNGAVAVRYRFRDLPEIPPGDWQLVYHAPTAVVEVPVEFEFEGLPIPDGPES